MKHKRGEKQKSRDRQLREIYEEYRKWCKISWQQPLVELAKPIQKGYVKSFTLRDDIARRDDADVFWAILKKVNSYVYSKDQEFKVTTKKKNVLFVTDKEHVPAVIKDQDMENWNPPDRIKKYFARVEVEHTTSYGSFKTVHWQFTKPWMFAAVIKPHYQTHMRTFHPEAEAKLGEINRKMKSLNFWDGPARSRILNWSLRSPKEWNPTTIRDELFELYCQEQLEELTNDA